MARVVVVGGGVAGLVAARALGDEHEVILVEGAEYLGGKAQTGTFRGRPVDLGPDAFITRTSAATDLCEELGLGDELIAPGASGASVFARGRLRPFPEGLVLGVSTDLGALARSGVLAPPRALRALGDLVVPRRRFPADPVALAASGGADPTIASVVVGRLGRGVLDALVDPLIGGINAGDARALSFAAAAPQLAAALAGRRSLVRALRTQVAPRPATETATREIPMFLGLRGGFGQLVAALDAALRGSGVELRTGRRAAGLARSGGLGGGWLVRLDTGEELDAAAVVLATPAEQSARLVSCLDGRLATELGAIPYASVALTTFAWRDGDVPELTGTGFLVERRPGRLVTAVTYLSRKWPRSGAPGETVVRASVGRHGHLEGLELSDQKLCERVRDEIAVMTGITAVPLESMVVRWPSSFPQYVSGHLARIARLDAMSERLGTLALAGAAYHGVGIPACVASGRRAAAQVSAALRGRDLR